MSDHETEHRHETQGKETCCCGGRMPAAGVASASVTDPVCGMKVDPASSKHRHEHGGVIYHFCCAGCRTKFAANPQSYLTPKAREPAKTGSI